jgi:CDP-glucose 4,6-dehydratase
LVPDIVRAVGAQAPLQIRNPTSTRPWQHVLNPLSGYLRLAEALWERPEMAQGWNFGPFEDDARPVSWIVERMADRWGGRLRWEAAPGPHPHEAGMLKLDSSRARARLEWRPLVPLDAALDSIVDWHEALDAGEDMRAVTLAQIDRLTSAED